MTIEPLAPDAARADEAVAELSPLSFWSIYAIVVAIFVVLDNPILKNPFDIDRSIAYSYLPIPFLIALCLAFERKLRLVSFVLATVKLTTLKFGTTYLLAIVCWVVRGAPPRVDHAPRATPHREAQAHDEAPPAPTPLDPARSGLVHGNVVGPSGTGIAGSLVYVSSGLDDLVFAPPAAPVRLVNDGRGFEPANAVVQTFQPLALRATDGRLHTAVAVDLSGNTVFNRPLLAEGAEQRVTFREPVGWVHVKCALHPDRDATLLVLGHPYWTRTSADGSFALAGIPYGAIELTAVTDDGKRGAIRIGHASPRSGDALLTVR